MQDAQTTHPSPEASTFFEPQNLLARYVRGRVIHFAKRQILTVASGLILSVTADLKTGLLALLAAISGEFLEFYLLKNVWHRLKAGLPVDHLTPWIPVAAVVQSIGVAACILLLLISISGSAPFFASVFLAGAAMNAGLALPYHKTAATLRLTVFCLTLLVFIVEIVLQTPRAAPIVLLDTAAMLILGFIVYSVIRFANATFNRNKRNYLAQRHQQQELEAVNAQLEKSRKEAEQLTLVARNANDSIFILDADQRIIWVNDAFTKITGYSRSEAIGKKAGDLMNGPQTCQATIDAIRHANQNNLPFRGEIHNITRDGRSIWLETNQVPVTDEHGGNSLTLAIERDITLARETAAQLEKARDRAEDAARAKTEFLANMSHEIRTPMNGVIGMADLICDSDLDDEQRVYAEAIRSSAQSLLTLLNDILDISKLDAQRMILNPVDFDLHACLENTILSFQTLAKQKQVALSLLIERDVAQVVLGDDSRFRQILVNLIGNALKFTDEGEVRVHVQKSGDGFHVDVSDTGIGIRPDQLERIFERFSQAELSTSRRFGGTGLGLTISTLLAEAMGGTLTVDSQLGKGSRFRVFLPFPKREKTIAIAPREPAADKHFRQLDGKRILVAEDNHINRVLIQKYLRDLPVTLSFAKNGREAVEKCRKEAPDLILMDMSMPEMSGLEAANRIRSGDGPQPYILALTANAFDSDRAACLRAGMTGFLTKPVRRKDLVAAISEQFDPAPPAGQRDSVP